MISADNSHQTLSTPNCRPKDRPSHTYPNPAQSGDIHPKNKIIKQKHQHSLVTCVLARKRPPEPTEQPLPCLTSGPLRTIAWIKPIPFHHRPLSCSQINPPLVCHVRGQRACFALSYLHVLVHAVPHILIKKKTHPTVVPHIRIALVAFYEYSNPVESSSHPSYIHTYIRTTGPCKTY
jgi:hypothetical protein